jgi:hypothetical protein
MNNVFWIGVYPGLTAEMLDFVAGAITEFALMQHACGGDLRSNGISDKQSKVSEPAAPLLP